MTRSVILLSVVAALAAASPVYQGEYQGQCGADGLYYRNEDSFVFCSGGMEYVQPCAGGTKNSRPEKYSAGQQYNSRDFCDVNLNDYAAPAPKPVYAAPKPTYHQVPRPVYRPVYYQPEPVYKPVYKPVYNNYKPVAHPRPTVYKSAPAKPAPVPAAPEPALHYQGAYASACGEDGLYYHSEDSFVFCVAGVAYVQKCAPGTKNSGETTDEGPVLCGVNLVDLGVVNSAPKPSYAPKPVHPAPKPTYAAPKPTYAAHPAPYQGQYPGKCAVDGLYFRDASSFVVCVNGNSYVQKCAPGSQNSPPQKYSTGSQYSQRDFCDVNLVDNQN